VKSMSKYFGPLVAVVLLTGCGYSPDKPVYDTVENPDGFPVMAVQLLDDIENDQLTGLDEISEAFGQLYTEHSELLDNAAWRAIIDRLGLRLHYKARQLLRQGLPGFTGASGYFMLAAFARPKDPEVTRDGRLFTCWRKAVTDTTAGALIDSLAQDSSPAVRLNLARFFMLNDSLHRQFGREYLIGNLFASPSGESAISGSAGLTALDRAFAAHLGLYDFPREEAMVSFGEQSVDLLCAGFVPLGENVYRAELYFYPRERIESDYSVALRITTAGVSAESLFDPLRFVPFDFPPEVPTSRWEKGKVAAAYRIIRFLDPISDVAVGLVDVSAEPRRYLKPAGADGNCFRFSSGTGQ